MLATPKPEANKDTTANMSSTPLVELNGESDKDAKMSMLKKRSGSCALESEPPQKMATLDSEPSPVVGKAEHKISTPLSCPTKYILELPCFMSRE